MDNNLSSLQDPRLNDFFAGFPSTPGETESSTTSNVPNTSAPAPAPAQATTPPPANNSRSARKRPRLSTGVSGGGGGGGTQQQQQHNAKTLAKNLEQPQLEGNSNTANDGSVTNYYRDETIEALNTLLKLSADHDLNYALGEGGELVMEELVKMFDRALCWTHGNDPFLPENQSIDDNDENDGFYAGLIPSKRVWETQASASNFGSQSIYKTSTVNSTTADDKSSNKTFKKKITNDVWLTFCKTRLAPHSLNTATTPSHILPSNILSISDNANTTAAAAAPSSSSTTTNTNTAPTPVSHQDIRVLDVILMIIRNLSFVQANIRFLTHTPGILRILTGALCYRNFITGKTERGPKSEREEDLGTGNSSNNICLHAVQALMNLVPFLDYTGKKLFVDLMLLVVQSNGADGTGSGSGRNASSTLNVKSIIPTSSISAESTQKQLYGQIQSWAMGGMYYAKQYDTKDEIFARFPTSDIIVPLVQTHIRSILSIFPPLISLLSISTSRAVVISSLELWRELIDCTCLTTTKISKPDNNGDSSSPSASPSPNSGTNDDGMVSTVPPRVIGGSSLHNDADQNETILTINPIFIHTPDVVFYQLTRLLWIPRLGPDSYEYVDPRMNMVTRVSALKLMGGYDSSVDYEVRDRALEVLVKLTSLDLDCLKRRVGMRRILKRCDLHRFGLDTAEVDEVVMPGDVDGGNNNGSTMTTLPNTQLYDALLPALTTRVGRDQTPQLAAKLLANLAMVPENRLGILYAERKITNALPHVGKEVGNVLMGDVLNRIR